MAYQYSAYGLRIQTYLPLPELGDGTAPAGDDTPTVTVRRGTVAALPGESDNRDTCSHPTPECVAFFYRNVARFAVRGGSEIVVDEAPDAPQDLIRVYLLGVCLATLLHQRSFLVLHASAVRIHDRAVVFMGHKGMGKSTTAATLHGMGHKVIADDVVALDLTAGDVPQIRPGLVRLKLMPEAAVATLSLDPEALPLVHPDLEKRIFSIAPLQDDSALPLAGLFVLDYGDGFRMERQSVQQAFLEIASYSYLAKLIRDTGSTRHHFEQCIDVARRSPLFRLYRSRDLGRLPELAGLIEDHVRRSA